MFISSSSPLPSPRTNQPANNRSRPHRGKLEMKAYYKSSAGTTQNAARKGEPAAFREDRRRWTAAQLWANQSGAQSGSRSSQLVSRELLFPSSSFLLMKQDGSSHTASCESDSVFYIPTAPDPPQPSTPLLLSLPVFHFNRTSEHCRRLRFLLSWSQVTSALT